MFVYCIFVYLLEQSVILTQRKNYKIHETFHKQFKPKTLYFVEMFCMAGVPGAGALTGLCIRGWKGKFHVSFYLLLVTFPGMLVLTLEET